MLASDETLLGLTPPPSRYLEAYRHLRASVMALHEQQPFKSLLVTSASPDEGKTSVVLNLSVLLAQAGLRVTVVDGDFVHPSVHVRWGLRAAPGLSDACAHGLTPGAATQATELATLSAVTAGGMAELGADLASGAAMAEFMKSLEARCDLVIVDSAPVLGYAGTLQLARMVDCVVLVARARENVGPIRQALRLLKDVGRDARGVIVNDVLQQDSGGPAYYYAGTTAS